jgi:hypothetical protein
LSEMAEFVWRSCRSVIGCILTNDSLCSSCRIRSCCCNWSLSNQLPMSEANGAKHYTRTWSKSDPNPVLFCRRLDWF